MPPIGATERVRYAVYAGPKERELMSGYSPDFEALLRADVNSWLPGDASVAIFLIEVLKFLDRLTGNWGVSIILMTVLIRLILFPLNRRSQTSMARYQNVVKRLQPKIDEIKSRFPDDVLDVYKRNVLQPGGITAMLNWYRAGTPTWEEGLGDIHVPTLYCWSDGDVALGREAALWTADHVRAPYRFEIFEGSNHWIPELHAERLGALLLEHLRAHA